MTKEQIVAKLEEITTRQDELWRKESTQPIFSEEDKRESYELSIWENVLEWVLKDWLTFKNMV